MTFNCLSCHLDFPIKKCGHSQLRCLPCANLHYRVQAKNSYSKIKNQYTFKCDKCKKEFQAKQKRKFCNKECRQLVHNEKRRANSLTIPNSKNSYSCNRGIAPIHMNRKT